MLQQKNLSDQNYMAIKKITGQVMVDMLANYEESVRYFGNAHWKKFQG